MFKLANCKRLPESIAAKVCIETVLAYRTKRGFREQPVVPEWQAIRGVDKLVELVAPINENVCVWYLHWVSMRAFRSKVFTTDDLFFFFGLEMFAVSETLLEMVSVGTRIPKQLDLQTQCFHDFLVEHTAYPKRRKQWERKPQSKSSITVSLDRLQRKSTPETIGKSQGFRFQVSVKLKPIQ